ncbi:retrovirus-related pol polyprotein from transposon TNT 1-94 [Tanacetum coccineum]
MGIVRFSNDTSLQSLDMVIMFKEISRYVMCTMLRASDTIFSRSDNFAMEILKSPFDLTLAMFEIWRVKIYLPAHVILISTPSPFLKWHLKVQNLTVHSDNGTEFKNNKLRSYHGKISIKHETSIARTPQQNNVVEQSSEELNEIPSKEDLHNLFGPLYKEYYTTSTSEVLDNLATNTLDNEDTSSCSSIIIEGHDAPQIVSLSKKPIANEPSTLVFHNHFDEQVQEDIAPLDGNTFINPFAPPEFEESESSSNFQDLSNMHEFHQ